MRAATPDVGYLLAPDAKQYSSSTYSFYHVPDQVPVSYGASLYGIDAGGYIGGEGFCPQSVATQDRPTDQGQSYCYDEAEMIRGFIASTKGCGWHSCTYRDYTVLGAYAEPYSRVSAGQYIRWVTSTTYITVNQANEGWLDHFTYEKYVQYLEDDQTDHTTRVKTAGMVKIQRFVCPAGMKPIATTDVNVNPKLCRSTVAPYIEIRVLHQIDSCPVNPNPCHPSSGDKSRAETDFTFAGRSFTRHYHSLRELAPRGFRMGEGWTHSFGTWIYAPGGNAPGLYTGSGYRMPIVYMSTNKYYVPSLNNTTLEQASDGSWTLTESSGDVSSFSAQGVLTSIRNTRSPSNDVNLVYDTSSRLSSVVDSNGHALNFTYDASNVLTKVKLPDGNSVTYGYDVQENLISVDFGAGLVKRYSYGEAGLATNGDPGLLTGITYEDGRRFASFGYDVYGRVLLSTLFGANGQPVETTRIYYNASNQAQVTTSSGAERTYTYNSDIYRRPLTISDANGTSSMSYDSNGRALTSQDARNVQTRYTYANNQLTATVSAYGTTAQRTEQTDWDATLNQPTERRVLDSSNALVSKTSWTYNVRGQVTSTIVTDPATGSTRISTTTYCEATDIAAGTCPREGLIRSVNGPRTDVADVTTYAYYASDDVSCTAAPTTCPHRKGDLWKVTNALGQVTETLAYDGSSRPVSMKDANGVITEIIYHPRGWLAVRTVKGATPSEDRSTLIDYWPTGLVKRVTQADGSHTDYTYDAAHRLTDIADSASNTIHYTLDNAGNRTGESTRDPGGALARTLSRVYDQLGRLQSQSDAGSHATGFTYDANGNTAVVTDALGRGTDNAYDPLNRLVQTLQDVGGIAASTQFEYDAQDNLTRVTDPKGLRTDYAYTGFGDLTKLTSPDTGATTYTYDSAGNRASQTDARGKVQAYTYDVLGRLTKITNPTRTYSYDNSNTSVCSTSERFPKGRLTKLVDQSGNTLYCYDRFGQLTRKVQTTNSIVFTTRYAYDGAGRMQALTYPDGTVVDVVYDADGRVAEMGAMPVGGGRHVVVTGATYAPFGPVTGWEYGNGRTMLRNLDQDYRPLAIEDAGVGGLSLAYGYDPTGNLTNLKNANQTQTLAQYGYDTLNRLTQVQDGPTGTPIDTYGYDATGNRTSVLRAGTTSTYTYPADSHRLNKADALVRTYDASGNTLKIGGTARQFVYDTSGRMSQVKAGSPVTRNYRYNAKGEQVWSYLGTDNAFFIYDEAGHLLGEYDSTGAPVQQIVWFGDLPVGVLVGSGAAQKLHYIEPDHLGTPRVVIDGSRNVPIWKWDITGEAFGATPPNQDPDADGTAFKFDLRFPGQRYDSATGLNYNYFRDYDPGTGRYVESDPVGLGGGQNTYAYSRNMPTQAYDAKGLTAVRLPPYDLGANLPYGTINCLDGVVAPFVNWDRWPSYDKKCFGDCLVAHEQSHVTDATRSNPGVCRYWGWIPFIHPKGVVSFDNDKERLSSEFRAYAVELRCLAAKLAQGACTSGMCQKVIEGRIDDIVRVILPTVYSGTYPNGPGL
jgi:RHS repeat-associated protein